jgi:hypothetical protein
VQATPPASVRTPAETEAATEAAKQAQSMHAPDQKVLAEMLRQQKEKHDQQRAQMLAHIKAEAERKDAITVTFDKHTFNGVTTPIIRLHNNTDIYLDFSYEYTIIVGGEHRTGRWASKLVPRGTDDYEGAYSISVDEGKSWERPEVTTIKWWADEWNFQGTWNQ